MLSNAIEHLAYRFTQIALPLVVLREFDSAAMAGLVGGLAGVPVVTSPWWARHLRQRLGDGRGLALVSLWQAGAVLVVPVALALGALHPVMLAARRARGGRLGRPCLAGPHGRCSATSATGWASAPPSASSRGTTPCAAARWSSGRRSPGSGCSSGRTDALLWVEGLALAVSALLVRRVVVPGRHRFGRLCRGIAGGPGVGSRSRGQLGSGPGHPGLGPGPPRRPARLGHARDELPAVVRLRPRARRRGGADRAGRRLFATALTAYGLGSLAVTVAAARRPPSARPLRLATVAWVGQGLAFAAMAVWTTPVSVAVCAAAAGAVTVVGIRAMMQVLLARTHGPARRAALAGQSILVDVTVSVGMLVGGVVIDHVGPRPTLAVTGLVTAAVALLAGLTGRSVRRRPARRRPSPVASTGREEAIPIASLGQSPFRRGVPASGSSVGT